MIKTIYSPVTRQLDTSDKSTRSAVEATAPRDCSLRLKLYESSPFQHKLELSMGHRRAEFPLAARGYDSRKATVHLHV
ncbi:unnamed protein product, partial [Iphiclides podalirius]